MLSNIVFGYVKSTVDLRDGLIVEAMQVAVFAVLAIIFMFVCWRRYDDFLEPEDCRFSDGQTSIGLILFTRSS